MTYPIAKTSALELSDGDPTPYCGAGVTTGGSNVNGHAVDHYLMSPR